MELSKYVYFCAQKSIIKAGNNKFQDLINVPRTTIKISSILHRHVCDGDGPLYVR